MPDWNHDISVGSTNLKFNMFPFFNILKDISKWFSQNWTEMCRKSEQKYWNYSVNGAR